MPKTSTAFEFIFAFLEDKELRERVLQHEVEGLKHFGITDKTKRDTMISLKKADIKIVLESEIKELFQNNNLNATVLFEALWRSMKDSGFDVDNAYDIIFGGQEDCKGSPPPQGEASQAQKSQQTRTRNSVQMLVSASAYSAGEAHIRKVTTNPAAPTAGTRTEIAIAGQGFPTFVNVAFTTNDTPTKADMTPVLARRADVDVHQYLEVDFTFPTPGDYYTWVTDQTGAWAGSRCVIKVK